MKKLKSASAILGAAALLFGAFTSCDYTGDTTFDAALAANTAPSPSNGGGSAEETSYKWQFADLKDVTIEGVVNGIKDQWPTTSAALTAATVNATTFGATASGSVTQFCLKSDVSYPSTGKTGLTMKVKSLDSNSKPVPYNVWGDDSSSTSYSNAANIRDKASKGFLEGANEFLEIADVQGPFKIQVIYRAGSTSDKSGRHAYVKIAGTEYKDSAYPDTLPAAGSTLEASYIGSEKVTVLIGGYDNDTTKNGLTRIHDVVITPLTTIKKVTGITVTPSGDVSVLVGFKKTLGTTVTPDDASIKTVTWSSSDTTKATVDANGAVTGVAAGSVTITATAKDGSGVTGTKAITVAAASATEVENTVEKLGKVATTVSSSSAAVATAALSSDSSKILITPVSAGNATITTNQGAEIPVTISSEGSCTIGDIVKAGSLALFRFDNADSTLPTTIDNALVTISNISFTYDNTQNPDTSIYDVKLTDTATPAAGVAKLSKYTASTAYGYVLKTTATKTDGTKIDTGVNVKWTNESTRPAYLKVKFTVTPKTGKTVKITNVSGTTQMTQTNNGSCMLKIGTSDPVDLNDFSNYLCTFNKAVTQTATSSAFDVEVQFVGMKTTKTAEDGGGFDCYKLTLKKDQEWGLYNLILDLDAE